MITECEGNSNYPSTLQFRRSSLKTDFCVCIWSSKGTLERECWARWRVCTGLLPSLPFPDLDCCMVCPHGCELSVHRELGLHPERAQWFPLLLHRNPVQDPWCSLASFFLIGKMEKLGSLRYSIGLKSRSPCNTLDEFKVQVILSLNLRSHNYLGKGCCLSEAEFSYL